MKRLFASKYDVNTWDEVAVQTQLASVRYTSRPTGTCRTRNSQSGRLWRQKYELSSCGRLGSSEIKYLLMSIFGK